jgi:TonB family protein
LSVEPIGCTDVPTLVGIRTILIRPDLIAAPRRSPAPVKRRTPCRSTPEGVAIERAGGRDWFSDHLFVEARHDHTRAGFRTSIAAHLGVIATVVLTASFERTLPVRVGPPSVMPAFFYMKTLADAPSLASLSRDRSPKVSMRPPAAPAGAPPAAPVEVPSHIEDEVGPETSADGVDEGVVGGIVGGIAGGLVDGTPSPGGSSSGPLRPGGSFRPPRKIKDVKPVYPQSAVSDQSRGTVIIDITIGVDGKIQEAKILHSVPALDGAALEAVRQWEYEPTVLNGVLVALIMTVVVNFTIQ